MLRIGVFALGAADAFVLAGHATGVPVAVSWSAFAAAAAACIGLLPRVSMPLATLLLIVSRLDSLGLPGLANHAQVPITLCALVLSFGPSADALTLWPRRKANGEPRAYQATLVLMLALVCLGYLFLAVQRLRHGRWELLASDSRLGTLLALSQFLLPSVVFIDSQYWSPRYVDAGSTGTIFFDGVCGLCNRFVDFLLRRDHAKRLRFATLQGTAAVVPETVIYVDAAGEHHRSDAALASLGRLGGAWSFVCVLGLVPRPIRDAVYTVIARNRYRWFGKRDTCRVPGAAERDRFLTTGDAEVTFPSRSLRVHCT